MRSYPFIAMILLLLAACGQKAADPVKVERDTTITRVNAFSELFLDSVLVEGFIVSKQLEDSTASRLRNFYNSRNYQFAWFTRDGLAEQASVFWNLHNQYIDYAQDSALMDEQLHSQMDLFLSGDTSYQPTAAVISHTELYLTQHFFDYVRHAYAGKMDPEALKWHIPRKKVDAVALLDSLVQRKGEGLDKWEPLNRPYKLMQEKLYAYFAVSKGGGWDSLGLGKSKTLQRGDSNSLVAALKKRLSLTGNHSPGDSSKMFNAALEASVKAVQKSFGFPPTGTVNASLLKALNVPVKKRIEQLLINMERMRWMPEELRANRIEANIPEFKIHVYEDTGQVFEIDVVVGKAGNNTVVFRDELKYIVFSPYWNIPTSIVKNEILPAMQRNPAYLAAKNMEQTGTSNGLPVIRQRPGGSNALGRVKFLFPNSYSIYFHDSPAKSLFARTKRDFSHGCIRLSQPKKLAQYLLRHKPEWTEKRIDSAMDATVEKWVTLDKSIPVVISYFTAWVDGDGTLNFREDIYRHDQEMADRMFVRARREPGIAKAK